MLLSPVVTTTCAVPRCRAVRRQHLIARPASREVHTLAAYRAADDPLVTTDWLAQRLTEVTVLDVRGHVDTVLVNPGEEQSMYRPDYDAYLEGHIPVSHTARPGLAWTLCPGPSAATGCVCPCLHAGCRVLGLDKGRLGPVSLSTGAAADGA